VPKSPAISSLEQEFKDIAANRYEQNEEYFVRMFSDGEFMSEVISLMFPKVLQEAKQEKVYYGIDILGRDYLRRL